MARPSTFSKAAEIEIGREYITGMTLEELALKYGKTKMGMLKVLRRNGVCTRSYGGKDKLPSWMKAYPVKIPHLEGQPQFIAQMDRTVLTVLDPLYWDVISIKERYNYPTIAAASRHFLRLGEYAQSQGLRLILLWRDELNKSGLENLCLHKNLKSQRICSARECEIVSVDKKDADLFYNTFHIQGKCNGDMNFGLRFEEKLVAMMTFRGGKTNRGNGDYVLQRFATSGSIPGAASRLLKHFRNLCPGSIMSYSDNRYASGGLYETLGFRLTESYAPDYRYYRGGWFLKNLKQRKHLVDELGHDDGATEFDMATSLGYKRCYDMGKISWRLD